MTGADKLSALRGAPPELWRRLGEWQPAEDFDGDGIPDMLKLSFASGRWEAATAISGRDGHILWRSRQLHQEHVALPPAHNDLDGDGTPDYLALVDGEGMITSYPVYFLTGLHAISGRTGKCMWSDDLLLKSGIGEDGMLLYWCPKVFTCQDLNRDGHLEVVLLYDLNLKGSHGESYQLWLAALSAQDGKAIWRQALTERTKDLNTPDGFSFQHGIGDLDGDGVLDLVIVVPVKDTSGMWGGELRATGGRDGKLLWRQPLTLDMRSSYPKDAFSAPAIGDLSGDGKPQVVILSRTRHHQTIPGEVQAFNGQTGEPLWKYQSELPNDSKLESRVLLADLEGNGRLAVYAAVGTSSSYDTNVPCAIFHPKDVVVLDAHGHVRPALEMAINGIYDFDCDGKDELLLTGNGKVRVARGGAKQALWERADIRDVREILPGQTGQPATVVVTSGESLLGLDGATGQPLWRCPVRDAETLLPLADRREPPLLLSHADGATICRRAMRVTPSGDYAPPVGTPLVEPPLPEDPRTVRLLPWTYLWRYEFEPAEGHSAPAPIHDLVRMALSGFGLFFLALLAGALVRQRWRTEAFLLATFLVATMGLTILCLLSDAARMDPSEHYIWHGWYQAAFFGLAATGVLVLFSLLLRAAWWLLRRGSHVLRKLFASRKANQG